MSKKIQLSIPTPCHEDWDNMTPVARGKFCGSCQKQVVDFSNMSDREIAQFFKNPSIGSVCGRFMQDQLERNIEIPKKRIPWVRYFFQMVTPAFLVSMRATAQGKVKLNTTSSAFSSCSKTTGEMIPIKEKTLIADTLLMPPNKRDEPIILLQAKPRISNESVSQIRLQSKNNFQDTITLPEVIFVSYSSIKGKVSMGTTSIVVKDSSVSIPLQNELIGGVVGGISVCRYSDIKMQKDSIIRKIFNPIVLKKFKVFPNPVQAGTSLQIEWKEKETGSFILQLLNPSGQLTFTKEMWINDEARVLNLQLPSVAAGNYFLRMTNKKSGKSYTEKLIIQ